jgi:hypothetical protein
MADISTSTTTAAPTTAAPTPPPNHGRKWTRDEDDQITGAPQLADDHFAQALGRSEHAVQSRRAVLAARMHLASGKSVRECAEQMAADVGRTMTATATVGKEGGTTERRGGGVEIARHPKRDSPTTTTGATHARGRSVPTHHASTERQRTPYPAAPRTERQRTPYPATPHRDTDYRHGSSGDHHPGGGGFQRRPSFAMPPPYPLAGGGVPPHSPSAISTICGLIKQSGGETAWIWEQDVFAPTMVQYYAGFQAYAAHLRGPPAQCLAPPQ